VKRKIHRADATNSTLKPCEAPYRYRPAAPYETGAAMGQGFDTGSILHVRDHRGAPPVASGLNDSVVLLSVMGRMLCPSITFSHYVGKDVMTAIGSADKERLIDQPTPGLSCRSRLLMIIRRLISHCTFPSLVWLSHKRCLRPTSPSSKGLTSDESSNAYSLSNVALLTGSGFKKHMRQTRLRRMIKGDSEVSLGLQ
jgi:hypothetical protein